MKTRITLIVSAAAALALVPVLQAEGAPKAGKGKAGKGEGPQPGKMFEKRDTDGDGALSKEEFLADIKDEARKPKAEERFAKLDKDGDGKLTKEEMKADVKKHGERKGKGGAKAPPAQ